MISRIAKVRKRDGRLVAFDESKIADAIHKAGCAVDNGDRFLSEELAGVVTLFLEKSFSGSVPGIEDIQDMVEKVLIETGHARMAKAYILYRERRARAREQVLVDGETDAGPQVGNPGKALVSSWSKSRIADALVREADLDEKIASEVASRVEEKVFSRGVRRITTTAIRSLVEAELFLMGYGDRVGRQALVGVPRYDVDRLLRGEGSVPTRGPGELRDRVAEAVLAQYALSEVYSAEVVDAHLDQRIHISDVGAPFQWLAASASMPAAGDASEWVEAGVSLAHRLGQVVTSEVTLAATGGPWAREAGGALGAARRLLAHPALPRRTTLGVAFACRLPDESGLSEALVREHWARFRAGFLDGLPRLVIHVPKEVVHSDDGRRMLLPVLAAAAETGRIHLVIDREAEAALVTPWYQVSAADAVDEGPALGVAGAVAVNLEAIAGPEDTADREEAEIIERLDAALTIALKALRQKRSFMESLHADPGGPLYRVAAGARPLVDGSRGIDLVHLVGLSGLENPRLAGRLRSYAAVRLAEEGRQMRLRPLLARERSEEAARRFFPDLPPHASVDSDVREIAGELSVEAYHDPVAGRLTLRFPRDSAPPPEALYAAFVEIIEDPNIHVVRLSPWPDRSVHASRKVAADL